MMKGQAPKIFFLEPPLQGPSATARSFLSVSPGSAEALIRWGGKQSVFGCLLFSDVALYQTSVSGLCDRTCRSVCLYVCRSVCPQSVLWQNGGVDLDAVWDGEWGRSRMDVLDGVVIGAVWGEFGVSLCNQWGLCDAALPNYFGQDLFNNSSAKIFNIHSRMSKLQWVKQT